MKQSRLTLGKCFAAVSDALQPAVATLRGRLAQRRRTTNRPAEPAAEVGYLINPRVADDVQPLQDRAQVGGNHAALVLTNLLARPRRCGNQLPPRIATLSSLPAAGHIGRLRRTT